MTAAALDDLLAATGGRPEPITVGMSGATVERWGDRILKAAPPTWDGGLDAEAARLAWLGTTPLSRHVPRIVAFEPGPPLDRLLTTALPGADLTVADVGPADAARRFGAHLRALHGLDPASCPFDGGLDARLAAAERRVAEGRVDDDDFEPEHEGRTPTDILDELLRTRPRHEDVVVAHGDWCFPNVVVDGSDWGMCDLAGLGTSCRWYDLGIGARSTAHNAGEAAVADFFAGYGIEPDPDRLRYYVLLDELQ